MCGRPSGFFYVVLVVFSKPGCLWSRTVEVKSIGNNGSMSVAVFLQRYHPSRAIVYRILSTAHATMSGDMLQSNTVLVWGGSKCKELSTAVGIPIS